MGFPQAVSIFNKTMKQRCVCINAGVQCGGGRTFLMVAEPDRRGHVLHAAARSLDKLQSDHTTTTTREVIKCEEPYGVRVCVITAAPCVGLSSGCSSLTGGNVVQWRTEEQQQ